MCLLPKKKYNDNVQETRILKRGGEPFPLRVDICDDKLRVSLNDYVLYSVLQAGTELHVYEGTQLVYAGRRHYGDYYKNFSKHEKKVLEALLELGQEYLLQ